MPDLTNSKRISYKATYVQRSPSNTEQVGDVPRTHLMRAVEKTAFVQSLEIRPAELVAIMDLAAVPTAAGANQAGTTAAFQAIRTLITDPTASSTLNNAALFANVDYKALVQVAERLAAYRASVSERIKAALAAIITGYKESLIKAPTAAEVASAARLVAAAVPKGTRTTQSVNLSGVPLTTYIFPAAQVAVQRREEPTAGTHAVPTVVARTSKSIGMINKAQPLPVAMTPALGPPSLGAYQPTPQDAILWAERNQPALLEALQKEVLPYMRLSPAEAQSVGKGQSMIHFVTEDFASTFAEGHIQGALDGFQARMQVEPVGNLHLERIEMYPAGMERGELVHSVPMAPSETVNISHKEWSVTEKEFEDIIDDYFEGYSEEGVAEKNDIAISNDSQTKHATALNLGASLSASYSSVTLSTKFGYNATSDELQSRKDSRNHSMTISKKASARTKKDHKVTFKVTSVAGSEDQSVRVITNPSDTNAMRIDYFDLARKWKLDLLRYGLRMTYDIVIPNPGSGIVTKVAQVKELDSQIDVPFTFILPLSAITTSNYDSLAADYDASVAAPPEDPKYVNAHKEIPRMSDNDYNNVHFDSIEFQIDDNYYISSYQLDYNFEHTLGDNRSLLAGVEWESFDALLGNLVGKSGNLSIDFMYQYIYAYGINITFTCEPKAATIQNWRLQVWGQIEQAAEEQYNKGIQNLKDQRAKLVEEINGYDALTLRKMEQEEIMKGVLRWLFGPNFYLVPFNIVSLFGSDTNDPEVKDVLDPNMLSIAEWLDVLEHGEFIKYIHNAVEWENVLYFTYPYFWDDNALWDFKKFLFHPDPTHRTFLRSGAARVVLTIRPGFEPSFSQLVDSGAFNALPSPHPYVTIAQEIQDYANTNYPGFPPANPEQNARPLLYLEQRRVWKEMQYIIQLLNAYKADPVNSDKYPATIAGNQVPAVALTPYLNGPITINGVNYNGVNDYNNQANAKQLALDPNTPQEALLPTYNAVPTTDYWGNPYFYKSPGDTGDYDLISFGADGKPGGTDKDADISANAEASLIATWYEYTPTSALDIGITMNQPNVLPPQPDQGMA